MTSPADDKKPPKPKPPKPVDDVLTDDLLDDPLAEQDAWVVDDDDDEGADLDLGDLAAPEDDPLEGFDIDDDEAQPQLLDSDWNIADDDEPIEVIDTDEAEEVLDDDTFEDDDFLDELLDAEPDTAELRTVVLSWRQTARLPKFEVEVPAILDPTRPDSEWRVPEADRPATVTTEVVIGPVTAEVTLAVRRGEEHVLRLGRDFLGARILVRSL